MAKHCKKTLDKNKKSKSIENNKKGKFKDSTFGWPESDVKCTDVNDSSALNSKADTQNRSTDSSNAVTFLSGLNGDQSAGANAVQTEKSKIPLKVTAVIVSTLSVVYLSGLVLFSFFMTYPSSKVFNSDISFMTKTGLAEVLTTAHSEYDLHIIGSGLDFVVTNEQADLDIDVNKSTEDIINSQAIAYDWPVEIVKSHVLDDFVSTTLKRHALETLIEDQVLAFNETATDPIDAFVAYSPEEDLFQVVPDVVGTKLSYAAIFEDAETAMLKNQRELNVDESYLLPASVLASDENLNKSLVPANELIKGDISVIHDGETVGALTSAEVANWVVFPGDGSAVLDEEALASGIESFAKGFDSVGSQRTYTRPDGKVITVSGGVYGWSVDSQDLYDKLHEAILGTEDVSIEPHFNSIAASLVPAGEQDWGSYYIDVDLQEQYARFYDGENIIWEADLISGKPSSPTPQGVWAVTGMQSPTTLVGEPLPGETEPEYRTKVQYWMPFQGNAVGFHDATWQPSFGGSMFVSGYGSHGCVNISYSAAEELYSILEYGVPVIVHG